MNTVIQKIPARELEWKGVDGRYTWYQAMGLEKDDWRLPTKEELLELWKSGLMPSRLCYWSSSSSFASVNDSAWVVYFDDGYEFNGSKYYDYYVRLVRELPITNK